ncbi:MAG: electron transport complex subunit RsxC [Oscillospiraceae bacterium]|jgi:electron transport complex protein RnfC|nr:electron transport complex subunit RsxC [Oscillospiraceae bacterium]
MAQPFFGGIHPNDHKAATNKKPIEHLPPPARVVIPMSMHIGAPCTPCVSVGDHVTVGQKVGDAPAFVSAPVHASISGTVSAVEPRPHFSGVPVMSVVIENDFNDTPCPGVCPPAHPGELTAEELSALVKDCGIVGMGGATFPTHVKISSGLGKVDTVILNASECEPYITSDHRLVMEYPEAVVGGASILARAFGVDRVHVGIEDNKQNAAELLQLTIEKLKAPVVVDVLHTRYPQGAEKQLCQSITGRQVPPGALPAAIGCAVFNTVTAAAIYQAVTTGRPVTHRIVTVSGSGVNEPKNLLCPLGTPISDVLDACGGVKKSTFKILMGGPMMGHAQYDMSAPIGKGTNAILAFCEKEERTVDFPTCIRCGKCVSVCPMRLQPVFLYQYERAGMLSELERAHILDCIECGCCAYICPGRLHLVQSFRAGKQRINNAKAAAKAAAEAAAKKAEEKKEV